MEYKNIIFDFDGTLVDTASLIVETMHRTIRKLGLPSKSDTECRSMIGYRLEEIPDILWPEISDIAEKYVKTYREEFDSLKGLFQIQLYPKVYETLSLLNERGVNMAIASSRSKSSLKEYTENLGISSFFQLLIGGEDVEKGKPSPEPVDKILVHENWDNADTLVVGDMNVDILMGKRAGTATCGVSYGNGTLAELQDAGANYIVSDFSDITSLH